MRIRKLFTINLLLVLSLLFILSGCSQNKKTPIVTINDKKLYMQDFLYEIYQVEKEGNQLEDYYQKNLGYSYWDYKYNDTSMRELAKNSVIASVVMYEILSDQAKKNGLSLTQEEAKANQATLEDIYSDTTQKAFNRVGLTKDVITTSLDLKTVAEKYKNELCKDLQIDKDAIRTRINRADYSSEEQYERAVSDEITSETDLQFEPIYNKIKANYDITIDFDYWDTITIGSITVPK